MLYQPLLEEANELRLITILPVDNADMSLQQVHCRLEAVSLLASSSHSPSKQEPRIPAGRSSISSATSTLNSLPDFRYVWGDYMALSYTWGDPSTRREIIVNGETVMITKNLDDCLRALREKDFVREGWKVWIDALCINQDDVIERGREVRRMREIYSKAYTPIIWLGLEEGNSEAALSLIERLAQDYCGASDPVSFLTNALHSDRELFGAGSWLAMHDFVTRRYWSRMWILQEVAQGGKNTPILCGNSTTSWALVCPALRLITDCDEVINKFMQDEVQNAGLEMKLGELWSNLATVNDLKIVQDVRRQGCRLPHDRLLQLGRMVSATDPRDKIYGLLGLFDETLAKQITVDYTSPIREVFLDFMKAIIQRGSLDVLYHCYETSREDFPSWLPDWSAPRLVGTPLIFGDNPFATSRFTTAEAEIVEDGRILSCKGILYDRIDGLGHTWPSHLADPRTVVPSTSNVDPYGDEQIIHQAIWRTTMCDRDNELDPLTASYECILHVPAISKLNDADLRKHPSLSSLRRSNIFSWCVQSYQVDAELRVCGRPLHEYFADTVNPNTIDVALLREALIRRDRVFSGRRFFTTEKGYLGVGLDRIQNGDAIAVLLSATMPIIIRREDSGYYKFVGECYIHGIMDGQAMVDLGCGRCRVEDIVLC